MKHQIHSMMLEDIHHQGEKVAAELPVIEKQITDLGAKSPLTDARRVFLSVAVIRITPAWPPGWPFKSGPDSGRRRSNPWSFGI